MQTLDIRKLWEVPGAVLAALYRRQHHTAPRFMTKSRISIPGREAMVQLTVEDMDLLREAS